MSPVPQHRSRTRASGRARMCWNVREARRHHMRSTLKDKTWFSRSYRGAIEVNISRTACAAESLSLAPSGAAPATVGLISGTMESQDELAPLLLFCALELLHDALHLKKMIGVVAGKHAYQVRDRFLPALQVHPVVIPRRRRDFLQHRKIVLAQDTECLQGALRIAVAVIKGRSPGVLIERLNRDAVLANHGPHPPAADNFRVGEVRDHFRDRPLGRFRPPLQLLGSESLHKLLQLARGRALDLDRVVFSFHIAENARDVLLRCFLHNVDLYFIQTQPRARACGSLRRRQARHSGARRWRFPPCQFPAAERSAQPHSGFSYPIAAAPKFSAGSHSLRAACPGSTPHRQSFRRKRYPYAPRSARCWWPRSCPRRPPRHVIGRDTWFPLRVRARSYAQD